MEPVRCRHGRSGLLGVVRPLLPERTTERCRRPHRRVVHRLTQSALLPNQWDNERLLPALLPVMTAVALGLVIIVPLIIVAAITNDSA